MNDANDQIFGHFRQKARAWLAENVPSGDRSASGDEARTFQRALFDAGYAGIAWPVEYGGQGKAQVEAQIFNEEASQYSMPNGPLAIGPSMVGPTILELGTDEQKKTFVRPILTGEHAWCQLFSEPGAGSDLASLSTRAVREGDHWVVSGHKIWTSSAHIADYGWLLVRTDTTVPKHKGLTMLIVDLRAPGVDVRPVRDMTGHAPFNEVHLDSVRIHDSMRVGPVNGGWGVTVRTLTHERLGQSGSRQNRSKGISFKALLERAASLGRADDPIVREALLDIYIGERVNELFNIRLRQEVKAGAEPGSRGSVGKVAGAMHLMRAEAAVPTIIGPSAIAWDVDDPSGNELELGINSAPASSLAGGTNEIQKSIIAERILGLPREPQSDNAMPFNQLRTGSA